MALFDTSTNPPSPSRDFVSNMGLFGGGGGGGEEAENDKKDAPTPEFSMDFK